MFRNSLLVVLVGLLVQSGCNLIDPDITHFDLSLPEKDFTVDTTQWGLADQGTFPTIDCMPENDICAQATQSVCEQGDCAGVCDAGTNLCKVTVTVALSRQIDLIAEKPELETIEQQPFINVTIDQVEYEVNENTLNFDSPALTLYVAPINVMDPASPEAEVVGTIEPVPAGRQLSWTDMSLGDQGEASLRDRMGDFRTVFNVIVGAEVDITAGMPMPIGRAVARLRVSAYAGL